MFLYISDAWSTTVSVAQMLTALLNLLSLCKTMVPRQEKSQTRYGPKAILWPLVPEQETSRTRSGLKAIINL